MDTFMKTVKQLLITNWLDPVPNEDLFWTSIGTVKLPKVLLQGVQ